MRYPQYRPIMLFGLLALSLIALTACGRAEASEDIEAKWLQSAHADAEAVSFSRWNDNEPAVISESCAKCHSTIGYRDFLGLDGAQPGQVDEPAPVGTTVECEACHNDVEFEKESALMPSGVTLDGLAGNANCMECHQGRASTVQVQEATSGLEDDTVSTELSFINIHSNAAGPTQYGTEAMGGYEYMGKPYLSRYGHVAEYDTCIACHDAHSLEVRAESCGVCHLGANTSQDLPQIRTDNTDYDGDGDISEGISGEISTLHGRLLRVMQLYAADTEGTEPLRYDDEKMSFVDEAGDRYATWTPRLLRAAYNYHYVVKGAGDYAHHGLYTIQLLYDTLSDFGLEMAGMTRPATD